MPPPPKKNNDMDILDGPSMPELEAEFVDDPMEPMDPLDPPPCDTSPRERTLWFQDIRIL